MSHALTALVQSGPAVRRQDARVAQITAALERAALKPANTPDLAESAYVVAAERPTRKRDFVHDGSILGRDGVFSPLTPISAVAPVLPDNGEAVTEQVILINGIMTDVALQRQDMQGLANTGAAVIGIHNSTKGITRDLWECLLNKLDTGDTPAIDTLARTMALALQRDEPLRVVGHSQGALIVACALRSLSETLRSAGLTEPEVKALLGRISVETYGGASRSYVDGPRYLHVLNKADLVPMLTGIGLDRINPFGHIGEGAQIRDFVRFNWPKNLPPLEEGLSEVAARVVDRCVHGPRDVYWQHRRS